MTPVRPACSRPPISASSSLPPASSSCVGSPWQPASGPALASRVSSDTMRLHTFVCSARACACMYIRCYLCAEIHGRGKPTFSQVEHAAWVEGRGFGAGKEERVASFRDLARNRRKATAKLARVSCSGGSALRWRSLASTVRSCRGLNKRPAASGPLGLERSGDDDDELLQTDSLASDGARGEGP